MDTYKTSETAFIKQLNYNNFEFSNSYPQHWNQLIVDLYALDKTHTINRFVDIGCGCGATQRVVNKHLPRIDYFGYDYSEAAISLASKTFNNGYFRVKDCFEFNDSDFNEGDVVFMSALGDVLANADELFDKYLKFKNINFLLLYRVRVTDKQSYYDSEIAYNDVSTFAYYHNLENLINSFKENGFNYTINDNANNSKNILLIRN